MNRNGNGELKKRISLEEVETTIRRVKTGKSPGIDGIYGEMLKNGGYWMKVSLCYLFNAVFDSQDIPQDWQNGLIVPLFKDGDREVATNYRGITLLSIVGKLFASIIERRLSSGARPIGYSSRSKLVFALAARQSIRYSRLRK